MIRTCAWCGKQYDSDDAAEDFVFETNTGYEEYEEWYGPQGSDGTLCAKCAIDDYLSSMSAGADLDFELTTGKSRDERPNDWEFNGDYD